MQFSEIKVLNLVPANQATRLADAAVLKLAIEAQIAGNNIVLVSLEGIDEISKDFVEASFGALALQYGKNLFSMYVKIMRPWVGLEDLPFLGWDTSQTFQAAA